MTLIYQILLSAIMIVIFYHYTKLFIFNVALKIAYYLQLTCRYPLEVAKGVVELPLVVIAHLIFSLLLIFMFSIPLDKIGLFHLESYFLIPLGFLLGIGMMGFSSLLCRAVIEILRHFPGFPSEVKDWLVMARSGWLRHHLHTIDVLFVPLAVIVTLGQVCGEEIVFRGVMMNYFLSYGPWIAVFISTLLFSFMQIFHMPSLLSAIFSVTGATIIGVISSIMYLNVPSLIPLIIVHLTFFIIAVL